MALNRALLHLEGVCKSLLPVIVPKRTRYYWDERPENKWRKLMMQVTLPRLSRTPHYEPKVVEDDGNLYGLDVVLHKEADEIFQNCKMVAVFLKAEMEVTDYFKMKHALRKMDIFMDTYPNHVMHYALKDSHFENLTRLYHGDTLTVFSSEPKLVEMLKITKKNPYVSLMGGLVNGRFMSVAQMNECSKLPSIDVLHNELSFILSGVSASTYNLLQRNQTLTVSYLEQHIKDKTES